MEWSIWQVHASLKSEFDHFARCRTSWSRCSMRWGRAAWQVSMTTTSVVWSVTMPTCCTPASCWETTMTSYATPTLSLWTILSLFSSERQQIYIQVWTDRGMWKHLYNTCYIVALIHWNGAYKAPHTLKFVINTVVWVQGTPPCCKWNCVNSRIRYVLYYCPRIFRVCFVFFSVRINRKSTSGSMTWQLCIRNQVNR